MTDTAQLLARARQCFAEGNGAAEDLYRRLSALEPASEEAAFRLGLLAYRAGRHAEAAGRFRWAARLRPGQETVEYNLAVALRASGDLAGAARVLTVLLARGGGRQADLLAQLSLVRQRQGDAAAAAELLARSLAAGGAAPRDDVERRKTLAVLLLELGRDGQAEEVLTEGARRHPDDGELRYNLGVVARRRDALKAAIGHFQAAARLLPDRPGVLRSLANALVDAQRQDEAKPVLERLVRLAPGESGAWYHLGGIHKRDGDWSRAVACLQRAADTAPPGLTGASLALCMSHLPMVYGDAAEMDACRDAYGRHLRALAEAPATEAAADAIGTMQPYYLPYQNRDDRELQALHGGMAHRMLTARHPQWRDRPAVPPPAPGEPVRVGVVSGFFRWHTIWKLFMRGWMLGLDRRRVALTAYSTTAPTDATTAEARAGFPRFVEGKGFEEMAAAIRADAPHVLLFPEIGMDAPTTRLAALRLAPVQCASWGHPDTTGLPSMDWFLTSDLMEPPEGDRHYTERLHRLPGLGIHYPELPVPVEATDFAAMGIPADATVYLCCQYLSKYLPQHDRLLARIAAAVPAARFVFITIRRPLLENLLRRRLEAAFAAEGLDAARHLVFLPYLRPGQYAALNDRADIYLDSVGWSGGNTTLEAVAHGLPVVTLPGPFMRGRHSAAILRQIGVTDTIAASEDDYVALAVRLAHDATWRAEVSRRTRAGCPRIYEDTAPLRALEDFLERVARGVV